MPLPLTIVLFPAASTNSELVRFFSSFANFTVNVSVSATTPILLSDKLAASVTPPFTFTCVPSLRANAAPLSPPNVNGLKAWVAVLVMASFRLFTGVPFTVGAVFVTVTSPTFKPSLSIAVLPVVTLSTAMFLAKLKVTLLSVAFLVTTILLSVLFKSTVASGATFVLF